MITSTIDLDAFSTCSSLSVETRSIINTRYGDIECPEIAKERDYYYHTAQNRINLYFKARNQPPMSLRELLGKLGPNVYSIPEFHAGILKDQMLQFIENEFDKKKEFILVPKDKNELNSKIKSNNLIKIK